MKEIRITRNDYLQRLIYASEYIGEENIPTREYIDEKIKELIIYGSTELNEIILFYIKDKECNFNKNVHETYTDTFHVHGDFQMYYIDQAINSFCDMFDDSSANKTIYNTVLFLKQFQQTASYNTIIEYFADNYDNLIVRGYRNAYNDWTDFGSCDNLPATSSAMYYIKKEIWRFCSKTPSEQLEEMPNIKHLYSAISEKDITNFFNPEPTLTKGKKEEL